MSLIPLGTPVTATGYGRHRVYVTLPDGKQAIGNDYSRDLALQRWIPTVPARVAAEAPCSVLLVRDAPPLALLAESAA